MIVLGETNNTKKPSETPHNHQTSPSTSRSIPNTGYSPPYTNPNWSKLQPPLPQKANRSTVVILLDETNNIGMIPETPHNPCTTTRTQTPLPPSPDPHFYPSVHSFTVIPVFSILSPPLTTPQPNTVHYNSTTKIYRYRSANTPFTPLPE